MPGAAGAETIIRGGARGGGTGGKERERERLSVKDEDGK